MTPVLQRIYDTTLTFVCITVFNLGENCLTLRHICMTLAACLSRTQRVNSLTGHSVMSSAHVPVILLGLLQYL